MSTETFTENVLSGDGTAIAVERSGEGRPVVLVGGALSDRSASTPLAAHLARHFSVLNYDRRGRGESDDTAPYAVEREIEDLQAVIAAAGGEACVVGLSSGAVLALEAAAEGLAITRLALYEPPFYADEESARKAAREYVTELGELLSAGRRGDAVALLLGEAGTAEEEIGKMRNAPMWQGMEALAHTLAYDSAVMGRDGRDGVFSRERVAAVATPTLVLSGGQSPEWLGDMARQVAEAMPGGRHRSLEGQTHNADPEALAPVLREFFTG
ncbi:pimeloyl-ACP methyl ester carboxylesterase [Streptosporangium becharense]|uniref:Pimeloyl-ACP methyl ester carboxylesterase n=1 Tax=Streptosporangium becharense TaxID=1816182 RepID=A0A7W9IHN2_9ACTN|nr:alpha/beta hydrolase [Streptosporangium becharense]MBB2914717.1 pimeloyl-ACP methyl ester carboxylesterase [Streptosporangium becharense]MBB5820882.1 pimeloyl-ACP methyl ester carboxylesterase [Streptosporangium becharense]